MSSNIYKKINNLVIYQKIISNKDKTLNGISEIACYKENGKYYLRFSLLKGWSRLYHEEIRNTFIKEFDNKDQANKYFIQASKGFTRINIEKSEQ